jgi:hypothetical protein
VPARAAAETAFLPQLALDGCRGMSGHGEKVRRQRFSVVIVPAHVSRRPDTRISDSPRPRECCNGAPSPRTVPRSSPVLPHA